MNLREGKLIALSHETFYQHVANLKCPFNLTSSSLKTCIKPFVFSHNPYY